LIQRTLKVVNKTGLHARPAAKFVETANRYNSRITVQKKDRKADAKSIIGILGLGASKGSIITITAEGEDESIAVETLAALINSFAEEE
jgi:phosphocarrier protein